jgi:hypothetical protein
MDFIYSYMYIMHSDLEWAYGPQTAIVQSLRFIPKVCMQVHIYYCVVVLSGVQNCRCLSKQESYSPQMGDCYLLLNFSNSEVHKTQHT